MKPVWLSNRCAGSKTSLVAPSPKSQWYEPAFKDVLSNCIWNGAHPGGVLLSLKAANAPAYTVTYNVSVLPQPKALYAVQVIT